MITILLIAFAAICKACADALFSHPQTFPFKGKFWVVYTAGQKYLPFTKYPLNAWHVANSLMIISFIAAPFFYWPVVELFTPFWDSVVDFVICGTVFNLVFNLFYNHIFKKK